MKTRPLAAGPRRCRVDVQRAGGTKHLFTGCCPRNKPFPQRETAPLTLKRSLGFLKKTYTSGSEEALPRFLLRREPFELFRTSAKGRVWTETSSILQRPPGKFDKIPSLLFSPPDMKKWTLRMGFNHVSAKETRFIRFISIDRWNLLSALKLTEL